MFVTRYCVEHPLLARYTGAYPLPKTRPCTECETVRQFNSLKEDKNTKGFNMVKQYVNGRWVKTVNANMSSADAATLSALLAGRNEEWTLVAEGGTTATVSEPNFLGFSVGKTYLSGVRKSAAVRVPHIKNTKTITDVKAAVVGVWDEDFLSATACDYCNLIGASDKGA